MKYVMMKCGHQAQGVDRDGKPVCVICAGVVPGAYEIAEKPDLVGRKARCAYYGKMPRRNECSVCTWDKPCQCERDSVLGLAFFEYVPDEEFDVFYCGCHSWD